MSERETARIIEREERSVRARDAAVKKARRNLLRQKEKAHLIFQVRNGKKSTVQQREQIIAPPNRVAGFGESKMMSNNKREVNREENEEVESKTIETIIEY